MEPKKDNRRVIVEGVAPEIDSGRFPIKRVVGETVRVEADVFTDGHEAVSCAVLYRPEEAAPWTEVPMTPLVNDRWQAVFTVPAMGRYRYTVQGWLDHFKHWSGDLVKRVQAGQDVSVDLLIGAEYVEEAVPRATGNDQARLRFYLDTLREGGPPAIEAAFAPELAELMYRYTDRSAATTYDRELTVCVDRVRARFSTWYEFFPRSRWLDDPQPGTLRDAIERLPYIAAMGFDIVYLPPIHPIGTTHRKGKNNNVIAQPDDVGSPWAIGSPEGGHTAIHPDLGTLEDLQALIAAAAGYRMEIALDIAFQVAPDHPYVQAHPEWFKSRPDGTIQYAENPPKKYEDIYPFNFAADEWESLWDELKGVVEFWIKQGVKVFRVDNPHTKALRFWDWLITGIKAQYPETIFLAEAFTRPKVMYYLAKAGFTQSYTYFAWRNARWELIEYFTELTRTEVSEFFRPNVWPNTPDILTEYMQLGGRPAFMSRLVLAATLAASYGIYGPAYELAEHEPIAPGKEEYRDSEKYEIKQWDIEHPLTLRLLIARLNRIRRDNPALQSNDGLRFVNTTNENLIAYYKATPDMENVVLTVVNLDPKYQQSGTVELPLEELQLDPNQPYQVHDLLTDTRYRWSGRQNFVQLSPQVLPAHVFQLRQRVHSEQDFDYYM
jgi:starch synthase (maltosyl-transferring)